MDTDVRVLGIAGSSKMLLSDSGIALDTWREAFDRCFATTQPPRSRYKRKPAVLFLFFLDANQPLSRTSFIKSWSPQDQWFRETPGRQAAPSISQ